jgi:transcriptional antiterminator NusG
MQHARWYVIQVQSGREQQLADLILRVCQEHDSQLLQECFTPRYRTRRKRNGVYQDEEKLLLPGYLIAVTTAPDRLQRRLRRIPEFTRLLTMTETFVPLRDDERAWIEEWTTKGDRTIPISVAYKKGETLVVTEGPLKGNEGLITRINRRKCLATIELSIDGKRVTTTIGLAIVPTDQTEEGLTIVPTKETADTTA